MTPIFDSLSLKIKLIIILTIIANSVITVGYSQSTKDFDNGSIYYKNNDFPNAVISLNKYIQQNLSEKNIFTSAKVDYALQLVILSRIYLCEFENTNTLIEILHRRAEYSNDLKFRSIIFSASLDYYNKDFDSAIKKCDDAINISKKNEEAIFLKTLCLFNLKKEEDAALCAGILLNTKKNTVLKAKALYYSGRKKEGIESMKKILKEEPTLGHYYDLATLYAVDGDKINALNYLEQGINIGLKFYPVSFYYDPCFESMRNDKEFVDLLKKYDIKNPKPKIKQSQPEAVIPQPEVVIAYKTLTDEEIQTQNFQGNCILIEAGYSDKIWLKPPANVIEYYARKTGLITFDPQVSYYLTRLTTERIAAINNKAFIRGVKEREVFINEYTTSGIYYSSIPELANKINQLRSLNEFEIALHKDTVLNMLLHVRDKYMIANELYKKTKFYIEGKCIVKKTHYNINDQIVNLQLSINYGEKGIYICTVAAPLSLSDANLLFEKGNYNFPINWLVTPGSSRKDLGISGGGVSKWTMPNFMIISEMPCTFTVKNDRKIVITTSGLLGDLWPASVKVGRWDLNKPDQPDMSFEFDYRIIPGIISK